MSQNVLVTDFLQHQYPSSVSFSPDGNSIAFVVKTVNEYEDRYDNNIWIWDRKMKVLKQLTSQNDQKTYCWEDEQNILWLERNDTKVDGISATSTKVWMTNISTGKSFLKMELPWEVSLFKKISEDNYAFIASTNRFEKNILCLSKTEREMYATEYKHNKGFKIIQEIPFTENGTGFVCGNRQSLFMCDGQGSWKQISNSKVDVNHFEYGKEKILFTGFPFDAIKKVTEGLYEYDLKTGVIVELVPDDLWSIDYASYWKDTILCMALEMDRYGVYEHPSFFVKHKDGWDKQFHYDRRVTGGLVTDSYSGLCTEQRVIDDTIYFITTEGIYGPLCSYTEEDGVRYVLGQNESVLDFDVFDGCFVYVSAKDLLLPELYLYQNGVTERITFLNEELDNNRVLSIPDHFVFTDRDGVELDGFVLQPINYIPGQQYPAILHIHGGPKMVFSTAYHHEMQMWAANGFFVLFCNPRGSCGKGNDFAELRGKQGTVAYNDLMDFVDECLIRYGDIAHDRIAVCGGSYGGFMTNWIIGHTNRFKCAVSQRSISDERVDYLLSDIGYWFVPDQHGGTAWVNSDSLWEDSPLKFVPFVKTPTLFIHSDLDYRCPLVNGLEMYAGLKLHGVDTQLCLFYGEDHGLSRNGKPSNRICRMEQILGWIRKYLMNE